MSVFERFMMGLIFAAAPPIALFNVGWRLCEFLYNGNYIVIGALSGLVIGLIIDVLLLRKILLNTYNSPNIIPVLVYIFYVLCFFLCFKRFPVVMLIPGFFAGFYEGRKLFHYKANKFESGYRIDRTAQLTSAGMAAACVGGAFFIYLDFDESVNGLKRIFNLTDIVIYEWVVLLIIIITSILLIFIQYWITRKAALLAIGKENK